MRTPDALPQEEYQLYYAQCLYKAEEYAEATKAAAAVQGLKDRVSLLQVRGPHGGGLGEGERLRAISASAFDRGAGCDQVRAGRAVCCQAAAGQAARVGPLRHPRPGGDRGGPPLPLPGFCCCVGVG